MIVTTESPEWLYVVDSFSTLIVAIAAALTAYFAARGLRAWRDELKGKRSYELAEEVLVAMFGAREVFHWMRSAGSFSSEYSGLTQAADESEAQFNIRKQYSLAALRYGEHVALFGKLRSSVFRIKVHFGEEHAAPVVSLLSAVDEILHIAETAKIYALRFEQVERMAEKSNRQSYAKLLKRTADKLDEADDKYFATRDELSTKVDDAVSDAERLFKPMLR